ncbi:hypothetical protein LX36DRAFT_321658 [Colletotrichum falcatum]|nr:hypothetical protein LX36DRAFT_321658 [Colletotrichum falcatum]
MHLPTWKVVGSVKDAFMPSRRGKSRQQRERKPKTRKTKGAKKKEKRNPKPKKTKADSQALYTGKGWQFRQCLPFGAFGLVPEDLSQPPPGQTSSSHERVDRSDSAASVRRPAFEPHEALGPPSSKPFPDTRQTNVKAATWSNTLSSVSSAASRIKDTLLRRRHTDLSPSRSIYHCALNREPLSFEPNQGERLEPILSREKEHVPIRARIKPAGTMTEPDARVFKSAQNLDVLREKLRKRAATSKEFNEIWESQGLPHLRKTLNDNYSGDYSITIQFNYASSTRLVEVMTSETLSHDVHSEVKRNVLPCFEHAPQLVVEIHFLVGAVTHSADIARPSQDLEDRWASPRNRSRHSMQVCGDSIGVEGKEGAATIGPAVKLGNNQGWLINWHLFEGIQNWATLDVGSVVPEHHLVHPAPMDCPENEIPKRIAKLHAFSGPMYKTHRPSNSLRRFANTMLRDEDATINVVTDWAFCIANGDEWLQNRLRYAPSGIEFEDVSGPMRGQFTGSPQLQIIGTTGRSSGFRYAVVCETPAEVREMPMKPTREWYLEQADIGPAFDWVCEGPGMPGDSGAAVVHEETECVLGQIWGRNRYGGSRSDLRVTYFTHIMDIFDDIGDRYPREGPLTLILGEDDRTSDTALHNGPSTPSAPRSSSSLDTLVRSTIGDTGDKHAMDEPAVAGPTCSMTSHLNTLRRSAARSTFEDDGIMARRSSMMIAT